MRHTIGLIAGASAVALAGVLSVQTGLIGGAGDESPHGGPPEPVAAAQEPAESLRVVEEAAAAPPDHAELADRIAKLETTLADREATLAERSATLEARDASIAGLVAALAERDAEVERLEKELAELRIELAELRDRFAFDLQLAAMKAAEPTPAATPLAAAEPVASAPPESQPITTIQFDTGSASLTPGGQVHAAAAAVMLADMKLGNVRLVGFADRTGSPARNQVLAEKRARAVADFLVAHGVPAQLIETAGVIEGDLPIPTGPGVPEPLNRSVSIVAVPVPTT